MDRNRALSVALTESSRRIQTGYKRVSQISAVSRRANATFHETIDGQLAQQKYILARLPAVQSSTRNLRQRLHTIPLASQTASADLVSLAGSALDVAHECTSHIVALSQIIDTIGAAERPRYECRTRETDVYEDMARQLHEIQDRLNDLSNKHGMRPHQGNSVLASVNGSPASSSRTTYNSIMSMGSCSDALPNIITMGTLSSGSVSTAKTRAKRGTPITY